MNTHQPTTLVSQPSRPTSAGWIVAGILLLGIVPLIFRASGDTRGEYDQNTYSLPTIRTFADELPTPNLADYGFASTPGYHLAMSVVNRVLGDSLRVLRLVSMCFALALVGLLASRLQRLTDVPSAVALALPLTASAYVVASAAWLLPDAAAWLLLLAVLLLACGPRVDARALCLAGIAMAALVFVRQIHLWAAAVLWVGAYTAAGEPDGPRFRRTLAMVLATLPAFLLVGGFLLLWHGAVPPRFQGQHNHINPAVPAAILALACPFGGAMLACVPDLLSRLRPHVRVLVIGAFVGLLVGAIPHTTYNYDAGRFSGIWNIAARFPSFAHRSVLMVGMAGLGGAVLAAWCCLLQRRWMLLLLTAWAGFSAANTFNAQAWQRYYEPFELMVFALAAAQVAGGRLPRRGFLVLGLLTLLQLGVTAMSLR